MKKSNHKVFWIIGLLLFCFVIINYTLKTRKSSIENNTDLIISPNKQYKALHNEKTESLQIVDLSNNKVVYELKDERDPKNEINGAIFVPNKWSPDSNSLIYKILGWESYYLEVITKINGEFTNSITRLNEIPDYTNCAAGIWSPDSKKLVTIGENRNPCVSNIYKIDPNKGITVKSIDSKNFVKNSNSFDSIEDAVWSPDSKSVTLTKNNINENDRAIFKTDKITVSVE